MRPLLRFWPDLRSRIGVYVLVLVLTLLANGIQLIVPVITGHIVDGPIAHRDLSGLWLPVLGVLFIGIAEAVGMWARRMVVAPVVSHWEVTWRSRLFDRLQYTSVAIHDSWESGQLLSRAVNDLSQLRRFFAFGLPFLLSTPIVLAVGTVMLVIMQPVFGLIMVIMAVPAIIAVAVFEKHYRETSRRSQDTMGELTTDVEESIQGIRILKSFGRSPWAAERFSEISTRLKSLEIRKAKLDSWLWSVLLLLPTLAQAAIVAVGTWGVIEGWTTIGTVVAAVTISMVLRMPIEMLGFLLADALMALTAAGRYWEVIDIRHDITDADGGVDDAPAVGRYRGKLRFDDVDFHFADTERLTLRGLDLTIEPGQTLALVGATGSGKTTLASLVPRLQDVSAGTVSIDDVDIRDMPVNELRHLVSVSFEDPILFSTSVAENVEMGAPGASEEEIWEALEIAAAKDFVFRLPDGLDTQVGEQGLSLSGGQRQRLALARAVIARPRILVLDDPLSAVDVDTEDRVQRALRVILPDSTTLIIAHRPSTAALADVVAVLDEGRIAALGTHEELLESSKLYRELMGASAKADAHTYPGAAASTKEGGTP
ncbi:ATP-binding cassette, subfamily B [Brevibacterium iodinum ATCC 49514]|uniref:ATP-binding cassette, subfamily B n=1 Tax=Brevibacterium iodinum ATCC 49514 TaxID=1255616 RepID=A0A2H1ICU1_9MICO|nr:ABC transporter ATP-binding protein [Brevibacterium iodinum]SMX73003.1 ATP-binding cassette, subfamily B [Brevibacterium iodinum ATCC 49514]SUW13119.1 Putative multidrug export ATP-binding/permease protein SAV1866 [Brevibacterium iodinum]